MPTPVPDPKAHLGQAQQLHKAPAAAPLDVRSKGRRRFLLRQAVDATFSMTDDAAFEVGRNVATSPRGAVFENGLIQLIQATEPAPGRHVRAKAP